VSIHKINTTIMATLVSTEERNKWVNVTWMPHASLSQTSHVCLAIRSVQASLDELVYSKPEEWQVRVSVHGIAGLPLVSVDSSTPTAPLLSIRSQLKEEKESFVEWRPTVSNVTHTCRWDFAVQIPVRWRDLPRDAFLRLQVIGHCNSVVSMDGIKESEGMWNEFYFNKLTISCHRCTKPTCLSSAPMADCTLV
jgi:hypothetical protein